MAPGDMTPETARYHAMRRFPELWAHALPEVLWWTDTTVVVVSRAGETAATAKLVDIATGTRSSLDIDEPHAEALARMLEDRPLDSAARGDDARALCIDGRTNRYTLHLDDTASRLHRLDTEPRATPPLVRTARFAGRTDVYEKPSPCRRWSATELGDNVALRWHADGRVTAITDDGTANEPWDVEHGLWSPDGSAFVATRHDYTHVPRLPLVHWLKTVEEVEWLPFPRAGARQPRQQLHVVDAYGGPVQHVPTPFPPEWRLVPLLWSAEHGLLIEATSPDKATIAIVRWAYHGECTVILTEDEGASRLPYDRIAARRTAIQTTLDQLGAVLWISNRTGADQLYLYPMTGDEPRHLATTWPVTSVLGLSADSASVYVTATSDAERPYDDHVWTLDLHCGAATSHPSPVPGHTTARLCADGRALVAVTSRVDHPGVLWARALPGGPVVVLQELRWPETGAPWRAGEEFTVTAADGQTTLHGVLYTPPDFDPQSRYPLIEVIYAGPQVIAHPRDAANALFAAEALALAQLGAVTVVLDGRGTPGRGPAFHDVVLGRMGQHEIDDHASAIGQLLQRHRFLDPERVGITGGSWGGYFALRALLQRPDLYRAGVVVCPVVDHYDHGHGIETIMDTPRDNPGGYAAGSNLPLVPRLRGRLLLAHGTSDANATLSASMKLIDALIHHDKAFDLVLLPGQPHQATGQHLHYLRERTADFFLRELVHTSASDSDPPPSPPVHVDAAPSETNLSTATA